MGARRELWAEESASRSLLEGEIRHYLTRYLLGLAANEACLRISLVRPAGLDSADRERLREFGFAPSPAAASCEGLWWRLHLGELELPAVHVINRGRRL